jgi:hypothetical protein
MKIFPAFIIAIAAIIILLTGCTSTETTIEPLDWTDIPINGNENIAVPERLSSNYGFSSRAGSSIVEFGDGITLLNNLKYLKTPHVDWAQPYASGPIKVLYIVSPQYTLRNPIELRQRSGFSFTILQIPKIISNGNRESASAVHEHFRERFQHTLSSKHDVIVMPGSGLFQYEGREKQVDILDEVIEGIKQKVKNGCGLICLHNSKSWYRWHEKNLKAFHQLSPLTHGAGRLKGIPKRTDVNSCITDSIAFSLWPVTTINNNKADKDSKVLVTVEKKPIVATSTYGKGRVVGIYFRCTDNASLIPDFNPEKYSLTGDYYEPVYAFYLKALVWAAAKTPSIGLSVPDETSCKSGKPPVVKLTVTRYAGCPDDEVELICSLKDAFGRELYKQDFFVEFEDDDKPKADIKTIFKPELPILYANGRYRLDLWLKKEGKIINWGCSPINVSGGVEFKVKPVKQPGGPVKYAKYSVDTNGKSGILQVIATDDEDRVFFRKMSRIKNRATVSVGLSRSCLPRNYVAFSLYNEDYVLLGKQVLDLFLPRIGLSSLKDNYVIASHDNTFTERHLERYMGKLYREAGFNTLFFSWHDRNKSRLSANQGLWSISGSILPFFKQSNLHKELINCPNKPDIQKAWINNIKQLSDDVQTYGGIARILDNQSFFAFTEYKYGETRGAQACQCQFCMRFFREEMRKKYQNINALNSMWGTNFNGFDSVRCLEEQEIRNIGNPTGWLEFRQFMNRTYATKFYGWLMKQHNFNSSYGVGCGLPDWTSPEGGPSYRGGDISAQRPVQHFIMGNGNSEADTFQKAYVGQPGAQTTDPRLEWQKHGPWNQLFNNADALWYGAGPQIIGNELAWRLPAEWMRQGLEDIIDGTGLLVKRAQRFNSDVKIFYSPESMAMSWLFAKQTDGYSALGLENGHPVSENTFIDLLKNFLFIQPQYITADEICRGELKTCKLLILPCSFNMDDKTAASIKTFVKNGGKVMADIIPAMYYRMGKKRNESTLSDLFGIDFKNAKIHREPKLWNSVGIKLLKSQNLFSKRNIRLPAEVSFTGIKPTTAKAQGTIFSKIGKETPACLVNNYGKGKAVLLNFIYQDLNLQTANRHRFFGEALMEWANLKPLAKVVDPDTNAPLSYRPLYAFQSDNAVLLGSVRGKRVRDGSNTILIDPGHALNQDNQAKFIWKRKAHIYDLRANKYLGFDKSATVDLQPFSAALLALLPYKVNAIHIRTPEELPRGKTANIPVRIDTGKSLSGTHLFRMEVYSPSGRQHILYSKNQTAQKGRTVFPIPFADNDKKGIWTIKVRDVLSGTESKKQFMLTSGK